MLPNLFYICVVSTICVIKTKFNLNADKAGFRNTASNLLHLNYSVVCIITFNSREKNSCYQLCFAFILAGVYSGKGSFHEVYFRKKYLAQI